jgi:hypothetical protein
MQCLSCNKTISQKNRFCRYCGATITSDAIQASRLREDERFHSLLANSIVARCEPASGSWGAHIYRSDSTGSFPRSRPRDCPEWAEARDWGRWFHEGLVVWDNASKRIGAISSDEAVKLIEALGASDDWKMSGIPIVERTHIADRQCIVDIGPPVHG